MLRALEAAHRQHGRLPWARLFEPAIAAAERGVPVGARLALLLRDAGQALSLPIPAIRDAASTQPWVLKLVGDKAVRQAVTLGVRAEGSMMFWNKVYDGAMGWTSELSKFGAHAVMCDPHRVITFGGKPLGPASVESPYIIRVAIALLMLASSIPGQSRIRNATPIRRAHPRFVENLRSLGVQVEWTSEE